MKKRIKAIVTSDAPDKTIVVTVSDSKMHPLYKKRYKVSRKYHVHDEKNQAKIGDKVEIEESKPISKNKTWVLLGVLEKAQG